MDDTNQWTERSYTINEKFKRDSTNIWIFYISSQSTLWIVPQEDHEPTVNALNLSDGAILEISPGGANLKMMSNPLNVDKEPYVLKHKH